MYRIDNIFTNKERKDFIKKSKPLLLSVEEMNRRWGNLGKFPGKQTEQNLCGRKEFEFEHYTIVNKVEKIYGRNVAVFRSWVNWTNGSKKDICWHHHALADVTLVYYMKTPLPFFSNGTLFRDKFVEVPQNGLLVFSPDLEHTAPSSPFRFDRYTFAMEMVWR
jgi:hypothetical protein